MFDIRTGDRFINFTSIRAALSDRCGKVGQLISNNAEKLSLLHTFLCKPDSDDVDVRLLLDSIEG